MSQKLFGFCLKFLCCFKKDNPDSTIQVQSKIVNQVQCNCCSKMYDFPDGKRMKTRICPCCLS